MRSEDEVGWYGACEPGGGNKMNQDDGKLSINSDKPVNQSIKKGERRRREKRPRRKAFHTK